MSENDFDDDGFARPPHPLRPKGKRVKLHQHSQHTVIKFDGPDGPIHIEFSTTITVEAPEDDLPPYRFDDGFRQPSTRRLPDAEETVRCGQRGGDASSGAVAPGAYSQPVAQFRILTRPSPLSSNR